LTFLRIRQEVENGAVVPHVKSAFRGPCKQVSAKESDVCAPPQTPPDLDKSRVGHVEHSQICETSRLQIVHERRRATPDVDDGCIYRNGETLD
jgi:hypothetical protein